MKNLFNIINSPVTTIAGLTGGLAAVKQGLETKNYLQVLYGVGLILVGLFANEKPNTNAK